MKIHRSHDLQDTLRVMPMLSSLDALYPGFEAWYLNKVVPGVCSGQDTMLLALDGMEVIGVALGKRTADETKLSCVRVLPDFQNAGVGLRLIDRMLEELQCEKPSCSVAEEMLHSYSRAFVHRYGFALSAVDKGTYRRGKLEYHFNA